MWDVDRGGGTPETDYRHRCEFQKPVGIAGTSMATGMGATSFVTPGAYGPSIDATMRPISGSAFKPVSQNNKYKLDRASQNHALQRHGEFVASMYKGDEH